MKIKISQPCLNMIHSLLGQKGYVTDFSDFYQAGKALSELPKERRLGHDATAVQIEELKQTELEVEITEAALPVLKKAIKYYIEHKEQPTEYHFQLITALGLDPSKSL